MNMVRTPSAELVDRLNIRNVITDFDFTLANEEGSIHPNNVRVIEQYTEDDDNLFVICTGRPYLSLLKTIEKTPPLMKLIESGKIHLATKTGNYSMHNGEIIRDEFIRDGEDLIDILMRLQIPHVITTPDFNYKPHHHDIVDSLAKILDYSILASEFPNDTNPYMIEIPVIGEELGTFLSRTDVGEIIKKINLTSFYFPPIQSIGIPYDGMLQLLPPNSDKIHSLNQYHSILERCKSVYTTMAIGDGSNDIRMLNDNSVFSVAMANMPITTRAQIPNLNAITTLNCEEGGFAQAMDKYVFKK